MFLGRTKVHLFALLLLLGGSVLFAQDRHLTSDSAAPLYRISPLAHGYIHGYEDGFHSATYDLVTGARVKKARASGAHDYKNDFGDRTAFLHGYAAGYGDGVADADANGFRAEARLRTLADGVSAFDKSGAQTFGEGLEAGYARQRAGNLAPLPACAGDQAAQHVEFCEGYRRGMLFAKVSAPVQTEENPTTAEVSTTGGVTGTVVQAGQETPKTSEVDDDDPGVPLPAMDAGELPPLALQPF